MKPLRILGLAGSLFLALASSRLMASDNAALPGEGFSGDRYANLWSKSPFAIATPDAPAASADYQLVGIAQFDGISYASLINLQTQEHFVVSSEKPFKDISLVSITPGKGGAATTAVVQRNGQPLTLTLEQPPAAPAAAANPGLPQPMPMGVATMPGGNSSVGGMNYPGSVGGGPPPIRMRRHTIRFPPPPTP